MKPPEVMKGPRLKVKRANSHIDTLIRESAILPHDLYGITNGPERTYAILAQPDHFALTYRPKEPIPEHFGAIIGDAVNNLREAMDYWMNAAVKCVGSGARVYFPFSRERKNLETSPNYPAVEKAFPHAAKFISKSIEPCRDTNLELWAATSLCNDNKHNDFLPTVALANIVVPGSIRAGTLIVRSIAIRGNANGPIRLVRSDTPITVQGKLEVTTEITFPTGAVFENQPVIQTLTNMSQVVSQTLDALEKFIAPYCS